MSQPANTTASDPTPTVFLGHCSSSIQTGSLLGATPWRRARAAQATVGGGALVTGTNEGAHGDGNGGEGPALATDARRNDNKNSDVQGDPTLLWGRRCRTGRKMRRERRQTTPNAFANERRRRTGGNGVTRDTTIRTIGRVPGQCQCDKPTEREWCDKRRHRAEPRREGGVKEPGKVTTNQTRGVQQKVEEGCAYFFVS